MVVGFRIKSGGEVLKELVSEFPIREGGGLIVRPVRPGIDFVEKDASNYDWLFYQVVDVELSMYDEIMISTMSTPYFKVSLSIHERENSFLQVWQELKKYPNELINIEVTLYDSKGTRLARGLIYEYYEKRDERIVELRCRSDIGVYLEKTVNLNTSSGYRRIITRFNYDKDDIASSRISIVEAWRSGFNTIWGSGFADKISEMSEIDPFLFFEPFVDVMVNALIKGKIRSGEYRLWVNISFNGHRSCLLSQLSQMLYAKFIYNDSMFYITPFQNYTNNPITIQGFVSNEKWDKTEQAVGGVTFISSVQMMDLTNTVLTYNHNSPGTMIGRITDDILKSINSRLAEIIKYRSYSIWGFAHKIINSGNTISLNRINYYVQDIKYETETLNTKKTFNATCVRFV